MGTRTQSIFLTLFFILVFAKFCVALGPEDFEQQDVNGIPVFFVDTHVGNSLFHGIVMPFGTWHDEPTRWAGRAHLWEHVIHRGSERFPNGEREFARVNNRSGGGINAHTATNHTLFWGLMHPDAFKEHVPFVGAMYSKPLFDPEHFRAELKIVLNEALEYQKRDGRALEGSILLHLLPAGHPLAKFDIGSQDQLNAMTLDDLKSLYYGNYGDAAIIVSGNFKLIEESYGLSKTAMLKILRQHYSKPNIANDPSGFRWRLETPARNQVIPRFGSEQMNWMDLGTKEQDSRELKLFFDLENSAPGWTTVAFETLTDFLQLNIKGSLTSILIDRGWIHGLRIADSRINNLAEANFTFHLTEEGYKNRFKIPGVLFSLLYHLSKDGLPRETLEFLKNRNVSSYDWIFLQPQGVGQHLAERFSKSRAKGEVFDLKRSFGAVSHKDFLAVCHSIRPDRMVAGYMGPEISGALPKSLVFNRPYRIFHTATTYDRWRRRFTDGEALTVAEREISVKRVPLNYSSNPAESNNSHPVLVGDTLGSSIVLQEDHDTVLGGIQLGFVLRPTSLSEKVALRLWVDSFRDTYRQVLEYFQGLMLFAGLMDDSTGLVMTTQGNSLASREVLKWIIQRLGTFVPSDESIARMKRKWLREIIFQENGMTGILARTELSRLVDKNSWLIQESKPELRRISSTEVQSLTADLIKRTDIQLALFGDYTVENAQDLMQFARGYFPTRLTAQERHSIQNGLLIPNGHVKFWVPLSDNKDDGAFGISRTYPGPPLLSVGHAALTVFAKELHGSVFMYNRVVKKLGYVHSALSAYNRHRANILLTGQTDDLARSEEIAQGWLVAADQVSRGDPEDSRIGAIRQSQMIDSNPTQRVRRLYAQAFFFGNFRVDKIVEGLLDGLGSEQILQVGAQVLAGENSLEVIASKTKPNCAGIISDPAELRSLLVES